MDQCSIKTGKHVKIFIITFVLVHVFLYYQVLKNVSQFVNSSQKTIHVMDSFNRFLYQIKLTNANNFEELDSQIQKGSLIRNIKENQGENAFVSLENIKNLSVPILTIFTSWKQSKEKYLLRNNTMENWNLLHPFVKSILFTNDKTLQRQARQLRWEYRSVLKMAKGVPILKYMYKTAREVFNTPLYGYANGDILFTNTLISSIMAVLSSEYADKNILLIGRRTNVYNVTRKEALDFKLLTKTAKRSGKLFLDCSEDYFITSREYPWDDVPEVIIGRVAYDNYLVVHARKQNHVVIDGTKTILAVHQTTAGGNFEGKKNSNWNYNLKLLAKLNKTVNYYKGKASCADFITNIRSEGGIVLEKRKPLC